MSVRTFFTLEYQSTAGSPGTEQSLADLNMEAVSASFVSRSSSRFMFRQTVQDPSITPSIPYEGWVVLRYGRTRAGSPGSYTYSGGRCVFQGYRTTCRVNAGFNSASLTYTFEDPWYLLNYTCYKQPHKQLTSFSGGVATFGNVYTSDLYLFMANLLGPFTPPAPGAYAFDKWTTGQQFADVITYATTGSPSPVHIALGQVDINVNVPVVQVRDRMCAEVLELCVKSAPDAVIYFTYANPDGSQLFPPLINCRYQANLTPVTLPYGKCAGSPYHVRANFTDRPDLQLPCVSIYYRINNSQQGQSYVTYNNDIWPVGYNDNLPGCLIQTIDLSGQQSTIIAGGITVITNPGDVIGLGGYPTNPAAIIGGDPISNDRRAFWANFHPQLKVDPSKTDPQQLIQKLIIGQAWVEDGNGHDITASILAQYGNAPNVLSPGSGSLSSWMYLVSNTGAHIPITGTQATLKMYCGYQEFDGSGTQLKAYDPPTTANPQRGHQISTQCVITNGKTGTYSTLASYTTGEPIPGWTGTAFVNGLAQSFYNSMSTLQYDGDYVVREFDGSQPDCTFLINVGNTMSLSNPSGGPFNAAWASMNALVQSVEFDLEHGVTTVHMAPTKHNQISDLVGYFEFNRFRVSWKNPAVRNSAQDGGGQTSVADGNTPYSNTTHDSGYGYQMLLQSQAPIALGNPIPQINADSSQIVTVAPEISGATPPAQPVIAVKKRLCCDLATGAMAAYATLATDPFTPS
jgi:hypothetical protein